VRERGRKGERKREAALWRDVGREKENDLRRERVGR